MIKYIEGDLLDESYNFNVIIHGCNCFNTIGSGVAKALADKYPEVRQADNLTEKGSEEKLGTISVAAVTLGENPLFIVNAYTQYNYGRQKNQYVSYDAIKSSLEQVKNVILKGNNYKVGMPKIGAKRGGGDWNVIKKIIENTLSDYDVTVVIYDKD